MQLKETTDHKEHVVSEESNVWHAQDVGDLELVPGTDIFRDLGTTRFVHDSNDVVLVPQPENDVHDPLVSVILKTRPAATDEKGTELDPTLEIHCSREHFILHVPGQLQRPFDRPNDPSLHGALRYQPHASRTAGESTNINISTVERGSC